MTHYLIDYENVSEEGLKGLSALTDPSIIDIFFSKNNNRINMENLVHSSNIQLNFIEIQPGKANSQELDKHLVSYLGYLIGTRKDLNINYVIVSKDLGYTNTINFWNQRLKSTIIKQTINIAGELPNTTNDNLNDIFSEIGNDLGVGLTSNIVKDVNTINVIKYILDLLESGLPIDISTNPKVYIHSKLFSRFGIEGRDYYLMIKPFLK